MPATKTPKQATCQCGNILTLDRYRTWCEKCGQPVYYDAKDQRRHKMNSLYIIGLIVSVFGFLTYIFVELIAKPLF